MSFKLPYRYNHYMGEHADDSSALTFIRGSKFDTTKDGQGNPEVGMLYYDTTLNLIKFWSGASWKSISILAGSDGQIQYNNGGSFGGASLYYSSGTFSTGGETSPDVDSGGLCLYLTSYGSAMSFKGGDVDHGMTSIAETDTYYKITQRNALGGIQEYLFTEGTVASECRYYTSTPSSLTDSSAYGNLTIVGYKKSGTSAVALSDTENIFAVQNNGSCKLLIKGNGDCYADGTFYSNGWDYAEYFIVDDEEEITDGALIGLNLSTSKVRDYHTGDQLIGIQSKNPGVVSGEGFDVNYSNKVLVGLVGQFDSNILGIYTSNGVVYTSDDRYRVGFLLSNNRVLLDIKELF